MFFWLNWVNYLYFTQVTWNKISHRAQVFKAKLKFIIRCFYRLQSNRFNKKVPFLAYFYIWHITIIQLNNDTKKINIKNNPVTSITIIFRPQSHYTFSTWEVFTQNFAFSFFLYLWSAQILKIWASKTLSTVSSVIVSSA